MASLFTQNLTVGYGDNIVVKDLDLEVLEGKITAIIGPNGCGKSTLLKTMTRILKPHKGGVYLDGKLIHKESTQEVAKKMAILPQNPSAPQGLTVSELVAYGRFPYQKGFGKLTEEDHRIVKWAINVTAMTKFAHRTADTLSGGQRQRVWIAMALAQETNILFLDEPTTFLDMAHQLEVLKLLMKLNQEEQRTIVMVIHDLNHAARFAHHMVALNNGKIVKEGTPHQVMTPESLRKVFDIEAEIIYEKRSGTPLCLSYDLVEDPKALTAVGTS